MWANAKLGKACWASGSWRLVQKHSLKEGKGFLECLVRGRLYARWWNFALVLWGMSPQTCKLQLYLWPKLLCFCSLGVSVPDVCADLCSSRSFGTRKHYLLVWMTLIQREWKTWVKIEFPTRLKSLLSFTSFEAVRHCVCLRWSLNLKTTMWITQKGMCTHNGDNLNGTKQETYFWGRNEGRCSGHGTFMITSGAYASYQKDFECLTGTIKTNWITGILRVF